MLMPGCPSLNMLTAYVIGTRQNFHDLFMSYVGPREHGEQDWLWGDEHHLGQCISADSISGLHNPHGNHTLT